jgi:RimJ/RimL family protein N-acetyltransferase
MLTSKASRRACVRAQAALAAFALFTLAAPIAVGSPVAGEWFEYDYNWYLDQGTGDYAGYSETMLSHSRYSIVGVAGDEVVVQGEGSWSFSASDGASDSGRISTSFTFSASSRRYLAGIDVEGPFVDPAIWFWSPATVRVGDPVRILDDVLTVVAIDDTVAVGGVPRSAARLTSTGTYARDDVYGQFSVFYSDTYRFDRPTGYVLAESYEEQDVNASASFRWRADVVVTSSSFTDSAFPPPDALGALGILAAVIVPVVGLPIVVWWIRRGPSRFSVLSGQERVEVRLRRILDATALHGLVPDASRLFGPLLVPFARRALLTHDPVLLATAGSRIVGLLAYDGESRLGSLFATDVAVAKRLLRRLRVQDFFLEPLGSPADLGAQPVDSFKILELQGPRPMTYDPTVVRPMVPEDLGHVIGIAEQVYGGRARQWVDTSFRDGDIAFVALAGERLVGFGFATAADLVGRLHTLTVLAPFRNRGIGTELTAARLSALAALGVQRVVTEISQHNAASLRVATRAGFQPVGETVFYSRVPRSSAMAFQRQF